MVRWARIDNRITVMRDRALYRAGAQSPAKEPTGPKAQARPGMKASKATAQPRQDRLGSHGSLVAAQVRPPSTASKIPLVSCRDDSRPLIAGTVRYPIRPANYGLTSHFPQIALFVSRNDVFCACFGQTTVFSL